MMLLRIFALVLLFATNSCGQTTITLPDFATKEWVIEQLEKLTGKEPEKPKEPTKPTEVVPVKPVVDDCDEGPKVTSIYAVTPTSLYATFHGVNVFTLKYTISKDGVVVKTGEIKPTSSLLSISYPALQEGTYTLKLEGVSCQGQGSRDFTINKQASITPVPGGDLPPPNKGILFKDAGSYHIRFATGRNIDLDISANGELSDLFKDEYVGKQRQLKINGETYNVFYLLDGKPLADLKNINLPVGSYYIQKIYARASKFPDLNAFLSKPWQLYPEDGTLYEVVNTELLISKNGSYEGVLPTYFPNFFQLGKGLSTNKLAAFKNQYAVTDQTLYSKGITHIQDTGGSNPIPPDRKFTLAKRYTGGLNVHGTEEVFENAGRNYAIETGESRELLLTSEIGEELVNLGVREPIHLTNAFFRGYWQRLKEKHPTLKVEETNVFGEYGGIDNVGNPSVAKNNAPLLSAYYKSLSTTENARKSYNPSYTRFEDYVNNYYLPGRLENQNVLLRLYYQSLADLEGEFFPNLLYVTERLKIASPDRKLGVFTWERIQDLTRISEGFNFLDVKDGWAYRWDSPKGELYIGENPSSPAPPYICYGIALFSQLLTDGFFVWSDLSDIQDIAIESGSKGLTNGGNRKYWKSDNTDWDLWQNGNPAQAHISDKGGFAKYPLTGIDAFYKGAEDYAKIENRVDKGKFWVNVSSDGGKTWFNPSQGSRGLEISGLYKPNLFEKHPAVDVAVQKLPIALVGEGTAGNILVYYNTYKLPTDEDNVVIEHKGKRYEIGKLRGSKIHLINL